MKKIVIIDGSMRNGYTAKAKHEASLLLGDGYEFSYIDISDEDIKTCKGCCACLSRGEQYCPLSSDGVNTILEKMRGSDGMILFVPNYSLQVPGKVKTLFDRLAFIFHRPEFFGKVFLPVVIQGVLGGKDITKYTGKVMRFFGTYSLKGAVLSGGIYTRQIEDKFYTEKNIRRLKKALSDFKSELVKTKPRKPTLMQLIIFRATRSGMKYFDEALEPDRNYYFDNGWMTSAYYYPVRIGIIKSIIGHIIDQQMKAMAKKSKKKSAG